MYGLSCGDPLLFVSTEPSSTHHIFLTFPGMTLRERLLEVIIPLYRMVYCLRIIHAP